MNPSEKLQTQHIEPRHVRKLMSLRGIIAEAGLTIPFLLAACTPGGAVTTEAPVTQAPDAPVPTMTAPSTPITENPLEITDSVSLEILQKKQEIEQRYGIVLMSKQDPLTQALEENAPVKVDNWTINQLSIMDGVLSLMPSSLLKPINGIELKIFIGNIEGQCSAECLGLEYKESRTVGFKKELVREDNKDGLFSLGIHEFTHGLYNVTNHSLLPEVNQILGDKTFLKLKEFKEIKGEPVGNSNLAVFILDSALRFKKIDPFLIQKFVDQQMAVRTLASFAPSKNFGEGIAGLSQIYILGKERFLKALGPVLDGSGYDNNEDTSNPTIEGLMQKYPKAEALYKLYENLVFGGKEYTP